MVMFFYEMDDKIVKSEKSMKQIFEIVYELEKMEKKTNIILKY